MHIESKAPEMLADASRMAELQAYLRARGSATRAVVLEEVRPDFATPDPAENPCYYSNA